MSAYINKIDKYTEKFLVNFESKFQPIKLINNKIERNKEVIEKKNLFFSYNH